MLFGRSKAMTPAEAADAMLHGELQLVDVRESAELADARVESGTHIPLSQLPSRLDELDRNRSVAFLCASGNRSAMATRIATKAGVDARNIQGGIKAWARAGLPLSVSTRRGVA
jgi:rhodanese-related sulfurtransferase